MFNNFLSQLQNDKGLDLQQIFTKAEVILSNSAESIQDQLSTADNQSQDIQSKLQSLLSAKQDASDAVPCRKKIANCQQDPSADAIPCRKKVVNCPSFKYLLNILSQYKQHLESKINMFDIVIKPDHHNKFSQQKQISTHNPFGVCLLNKYHHLLYQHQNEFENIYNLLNKNIYTKHSCNLSKCLSMRRHHRNRLKITEECGLKKLYNGSNLIEQQILDMIHCYFMHSYDTGCRLTNAETLSMCDEKQPDRHLNIKLIQQIISAKNKLYKTIGEEKISEQNINSTRFVTRQYNNGVRYYYWPLYKGSNQKFDPAASVPIKQTISTQNLQTIGHWYIEKKYSNFEDEMLNNEICTVPMQQWNNIEEKAKLYSQSIHARSMICLRNESAKYYDMNTNTTEKICIQPKHLAAIKFYTDFDELQRKFSETFRKLSANETDEELKNRHRNYYFWGKYLRECVECFGMKCCDMKLYHGIQEECNFSSVYPYFKGPFSASKEYMVALNFSNFTGMLLELNLNKDAWQQRLDVDRMNCFECGWISNFPHEKEILFLGGLNRHTIETIINVKTNMNYDIYITAIRQMTYSSTNWSVSLDILKPDKKPTTEEKKIILKKPTTEQKQMIFRLMSHQFYRHEKYREQDDLAYEFKGCPPYIKKLLHEHCSNIQAIVFGEKLYPDSDKQNFIFKTFFQLENKWADLGRLTTLFPQIELIGFQFENIFAMEKSLEFTYQFIKDNTDIPLRLIIVKVEVSDVEGKTKINDLVTKFTDKFKDMEVKWKLRVRSIDDKFIDSTVKDLGINVTNSSKLMKEIQKFKNKETKLMQALTKGLIVDIMKV
eukprot:292088_1